MRQEFGQEYQIILPDKDRPAVGFIMNGGRRWSVQHGLSLRETYEQSYEKIRSFLNAHRDELSDAAIYALTIHNLSRPAGEIASMLDCMPDVVKAYRDDGFAVVVYGDLELLDEEFRTWAVEVNRETCDDFDSQRLLVLPTAASAFWEDQLLLMPNDELASRYGLARAMVDRVALLRFGLVLRTGGGFRLSDFMPRACGYAEFTIADGLFNDVDLSAWFLSGKEKLRTAAYGS